MLGLRISFDAFLYPLVDDIVLNINIGKSPAQSDPIYILMKVEGYKIKQKNYFQTLPFYNFSTHYEPDFHAICN